MLAASLYFYAPTRAVIEGIRTHFGNNKIVYYDLGGIVDRSDKVSCAARTLALKL